MTIQEARQILGVSDKTTWEDVLEVGIGVLEVGIRVYTHSSLWNDIVILIILIIIIAIVLLIIIVYHHLVFSLLLSLLHIIHDMLDIMSYHIISYTNRFIE